MPNFYRTRSVTHGWRLLETAVCVITYKRRLSIDPEMMIWLREYVKITLQAPEWANQANFFQFKNQSNSRLFNSKNTLSKQIDRQQQILWMKAKSL